MGRDIIIFPALQELEELLGTPLFKKTHEGALDGLHFGTGNLGDLAIAIDIAAGDLFELEIASDVGVDENLGEFTGSDNELGNEINGVVAVTTKLCGDLLIRTILTVQLRNGSACSLYINSRDTHLRQVKTGAVTTVVVVAVHVEDLLALHGQ